MPSNQVRDTRLLVTMSCSIVICNNYNISVSMVMVREGVFSRDSSAHTDQDLLVMVQTTKKILI